MLAIADAPWPGEGGRLADGMVRDHYTTALTATGGSGGYHWVITGHEPLPPGLTIDDATGMIDGVPLPEAQGTTPLHVELTDSAGSIVTRKFSLTINSALQITQDPQRIGPDQIRLRAIGGAPPYTWHPVAGTALPEGMHLDENTGTITVAPTADALSARVTIRAIDSDGHCDDERLTLRVRKAGLVRERRRIDVRALAVRFPAGFRWLRHPSFWLALVALWVPLAGIVPIAVYSFTTPGQHGKYLAVGLLTAIAALVAGCLIGFLFGLPKVGPRTLGRQVPYLPSTNLPEVSDWLTKLLLGAGLVQLTHLGAPVADLIDHIAAGLFDTGTFAGSAKVLAGGIVFGYTGIGLLAGYMLTALWYYRKLNAGRL